MVMDLEEEKAGREREGAKKNVMIPEFLTAAMYRFIQEKTLQRTHIARTET